MNRQIKKEADITHRKDEMKRNKIQQAYQPINKNLAKPIIISKNKTLFKSANLKFIQHILETILKWVFREVRIHGEKFKIGVVSIFIVVGFVCLLINMVSFSVPIFIKMAERNQDDADFTLSPANESNALADRFLLHAPIEALCESDDMREWLVGCTPRWLLFSQLSNPLEQSAINDNQQIGNTSKLDLKELRAFLLLFDQFSEKSIGFGRNADTVILEPAQALLNQQAADYLNLSMNGQSNPKVTLQIDIINALIQQQVLTTNLISIQLKENSSSSDIMTPIQQQNLIRDSLALYIGDMLRAAYNNYTGGQIQMQLINTTLLKQSSQSALTAWKQLEKQNITMASQFEFYATELKLPQSFINTIQSLGFFSLIDNPENIQPLVDAIQTLDDNKTLNVSSAIDQLGYNAVDALNISMSIEIVQLFDSSFGKWPAMLGNVIALDSNSIMNLISNNVINSMESFMNTASLAGDQEQRLILNLFNLASLRNSFMNSIKAFNLDNYVILENIIVQNKANIYKSEQSIQDYFLRFSNALYYKLGKDHKSTPAAPLQSIMQQFLRGMAFIENIIASSIFLLIVLSIILIYSLMVQNLSEKRYELGMMRALGLHKGSIFLLISIQGLVYAVPGCILGLILAYLIQTIGEYVILNSCLLSVKYEPSITALSIGIALGIIMPIVANLVPVSKALESSLRSALDLYHRSMNAILINVQKLESLGISLAQTVMALTLIASGLISYYLIPYSFVYRNFGLFLTILNIILMFLIFGVTILFNLLQKPMEFIILNITFYSFCPKRNRFLKTIVEKNMKGHQSRNAKTTVMFSMALSFLIFAGAGFQQQIDIIGRQLEKGLGTDIAVFTLLSDNRGLPEGPISAYLDSQKLNANLTYSFLAADILSQFGMDNIVSVSLTNLGGFPSITTKIYGVDPNYLDCTYYDYYSPTSFYKQPEKILPNGKPDAISELSSYHSDIDTIKEKKQIKNITTNSFISNALLNASLPEIYITQEQLLQNQTIRLADEELETMSIPIILPEGLKYPLSINSGDQLFIELNYQFAASKKIRAKVISMAKSMPAFKYSAYQSAQFSASAIISNQDLSSIVYTMMKQENYTAQQLKGIQQSLNDVLLYNLSHNIVKDWLVVKVGINNQELKQKAVSAIINGIKSELKNDLSFAVNTQYLIEIMSSSSQMINYFYLAIAFIAIIISFFLILISFQQNVKENQHEIGVLRAVGLSKMHMSFTYMSEAFILTFASIVIGAGCGLLIAVTLCYQFAIIVEMEFRFFFPLQIFLFTTLFGISVALLASYFALRKVQKESIAGIFKPSAI